ncbi:hypothetical protein EVAR_71433_1 [Eumeta japonica]|uniref:Uncharacterized protein n=1 Tax=Eumeta variegata TaxID=151549 RepID=A0A4C1SFB8_EUMVA|nr:hypothetical protein EVAR_71433_1 [Eumeta japonica]
MIHKIVYATTNNIYIYSVVVGDKQKQAEKQRHDPRTLRPRGAGRGRAVVAAATRLGGRRTCPARHVYEPDAAVTPLMRTDMTMSYPPVAQWTTATKLLRVYCGNRHIFPRCLKVLNGKFNLKDVGKLKLLKVVVCEGSRGVRAPAATLDGGRSPASTTCLSNDIAQDIRRHSQNIRESRDVGDRLYVHILDASEESEARPESKTTVRSRSDSGPLALGVESETGIENYREIATRGRLRSEWKAGLESKTTVRSRSDSGLLALGVESETGIENYHSRPTALGVESGTGIENYREITIRLEADCAGESGTGIETTVRSRSDSSRLRGVESETGIENYREITTQGRLRSGWKARPESKTTVRSRSDSRPTALGVESGTGIENYREIAVRLEADCGRSGKRDWNQNEHRSVQKVKEFIYVHVSGVASWANRPQERVEQRLQDRLVCVVYTHKYYKEAIPQEVERILMNCIALL